MLWKFIDLLIIGASITILFIFLIISRVSCANSDYVSMAGKIDTLSMLDRNYLVNISVKNVPIQCFFDTGNETTEFLLSSVEPVSFISITSKIDINGEKISRKLIQLDTLSIGHTKYLKRGLYAGVDSLKKSDLSILGNDIYEKFVWKLDHVHQQIYFSQDPKVFTEDYILAVPFAKDMKLASLEATIAGKNYKFILDTGYPEFAHINDSTISNTTNWYSCLTYNYLLQYHKPITNESEHSKKQTLCIQDMNIGHLLFNNEIINYNKYPNNLLGRDFCNRFEYIIIDYPNRMIYFGPTYHKSSFYLHELKRKINTLGIDFSYSKPLKIIGISEEMKKKGLDIGDTIIKINNILVENNPDLLKGFKNLRETVLPENSLFKIHYIDDIVEITVKKENKLKAFTLFRKSYIEEPDTVISYNGAFLESYPIYKEYKPVLVDSLKLNKGWYKGGIYIKYINNKKGTYK
ncbi:hypothetical protein [Parabacteroides pacaensis]|uniref:hypothetical protein n=1 Tax=Parabacteroides pacaensis TaxID=2086575 RepID=UPI000D0FE812|nr:hypothetical protein [Parabacteroides pacaensis]